MAMLRLCQRLLPYKTDISEPLMKGIQLVSLVDEQVGLGAGEGCWGESVLSRGAAHLDVRHYKRVKGIVQLVQLVDGQIGLGGRGRGEAAGGHA